MAGQRQRAFTAAYAASQPLFDALRLGCERIDQQKANLEIARDLVQRLHVKLSVVDTDEESRDHERYVACAMGAYTAAMDGYATVFEALATLTAADVSEGREQRDGHDNFVVMAKQAKEAKLVSEEFALRQGKTRPDLGNTVSGQIPVGRKRTRSDETLAKSEDARSSKAQKLSGQGDESRQRPLNINASLTKTPSTRVDAVENKAGQNHQLELKSENDRPKIQQTEPLGCNVKTSRHTPPTQDAPGEDTSKRELDLDYISLEAGAEIIPLRNEPFRYKHPGVEYEDVSAEVEARLKAKEEKQMAKEKEKKRKRKSDQSIAGVESAEKQAKKRSKHSDEHENVMRAPQNRGRLLQKKRKEEQNHSGEQSREKIKKNK